MKQLLVLAAVVSMAASGCVGSSQFVKKDNGPASHIARSQNASRPNVMRTAYHEGPSGYDMNMTGGLLYGLQPQSGCQTCQCQCGCDCCSEGSCCDGGCCGECSCGCPQDCCCDCSCGCADECCGDCCCGDTCCGDCSDGGSGCCICNAMDRMRCRMGGGCSDECGGCNDGCGPCQRIAGRLASGGCCPHSGGYPANYNFAPGPQSGQTAYPYYTTRGPRDFLMCNPQPLGPY